MQSIVKGIIRKYNEGFTDAPVERIVELTSELSKFSTFGLTRQNELRDFLIHEHFITDDELFWTMFGHFYIACSQTFLFQQQITRAINRGTRLELPLNVRIILSNTSYFVNRLDELKEQYKNIPEEEQNKIEEKIREKQEDEDLSGFSFRDLKYEHVIAAETKDWEDYLENVTAQEDITLYRGFLVPEDADVRVGRTIDDPSSHMQDTGLGFSFSIDKEVAIQHAVMNSSTQLMFKMYGEDLIGDTSQYKTWNEFFTAFQQLDVSEEIIKTTLKFAEYEKVNWSGASLNKSRKYIGFDVRPCVGTYAIKKSDIVTALNYKSMEKELFCFPTSVTLMRYDFVTWKKQKEWRTKDIGLNPFTIQSITQSTMPLQKIVDMSQDLHLSHELFKSIDTKKMDKDMKDMRKILDSQDDYFASFSPIHRIKQIKKRRKKRGKTFGKNKKKR